MPLLREIVQDTQFKSSSVLTNRDPTSGSKPAIRPEWRWTNRSVAVTGGETSPDLAVTETLLNAVGREFGGRFEMTVAGENGFGVIQLNEEVR